MEKKNALDNKYSEIPCYKCPIMPQSIVNLKLVGIPSSGETIIPSTDMRNVGSNIKEALSLTGAGVIVDQLTGTETITTSQFSNDKKQLIVETVKIVTQFTLSGGKDGKFTFSLTQTVTEKVDYYTVGEENRNPINKIFGAKFLNINYLGSEKPLTYINDVDVMGSSIPLNKTFSDKLNSVLFYNNSILAFANAKFTDAKVKGLLETLKKAGEKLQKVKPIDQTIR
jgi:hypothetical protein